jgi:hypothetical protein
MEHSFGLHAPCILSKTVRQVSCLSFSPSGLSRSSLFLVSPSCSPGRTGASLAGVAARRWRRDGAGSSFRCSFFLEFTYMESESRLVDLGDQICHDMDLICFTVSRWWPGEVQVEKRRSCISPNKVCIWSLELGCSDQARFCLVLLCFPAILPWWEQMEVMRELRNSFNKVKVRLMCGLTFVGQRFKLLPSRHGDVEGSQFAILGCSMAGQRQGIYEASFGRASTAAPSWLLSLMVEGRPLHPLSPATVSSDRWLQVFFYLQAVVPKRRPLCSITVGSRSSVPSGNVPGDGVLGYDVMQRCGGEGAGPDCTLSFRSRVPSAKCEDFVVISDFLVVCAVSCNSTAFS